MAQSIDPITPIPTSGTYTEVRGVSADGLVVVGHGSSDDTAGSEAFRWTLGGGSVGLGFLDETQPSPYSIANAVSGDGAIVVGESLANATNIRGFRWTSGTGMLELPLPTGGFNSNAYGISTDGTVIVGEADGTATFGGTSPVRWTTNGTVVEFLDTNARGTAYGTNSDGTVIVGQWVDNTFAPNPNVAFRWEGGTFLSLGHLTGGNFSRATAVNADGTVVIGNATASTFFEHAFRWTSGTGMVDLGFLSSITGHNASQAMGVSANGNVIVGRSWNATHLADPNYAAFYWTNTDGIQNLATVLTDAGVDLTGWELFEAMGVSADGMVIVGDATDPLDRDVGFIARLSGSGGPGPGVITPEVVQRSFISMTALTEAGNDYLDRLLQTHQVPSDDCTQCAFGYGFGGTLRGDDPAGTLLAGAKMELLPGLIVGGSLAGFATDTPLIYDGRIGTAGVAATLFAETITDNGLRIAGAVSADAFSASVTRGYLNGNTPVVSHGATSGNGIGASFTLAWDYPVTDRFTARPFAGISATATHIAGWTESDGPFPASFQDINDTLVLSRIGVIGMFELDDDLELWGSLAWAHRYSGATTAIAGTLIADLTVAGVPVAQDWLEISAGVKAPVLDGKAMAMASVTASIAANEAFLQARAGISYPF